MTNPHDLNLIGSVLIIKSDTVDDVAAASDLLLPTGKTIAELLYDQEKNTIEETKEEPPKESETQSEQC